MQSYGSPQQPGPYGAPPYGAPPQPSPQPYAPAPAPQPYGPAAPQTYGPPPSQPYVPTVTFRTKEGVTYMTYALLVGLIMDAIQGIFGVVALMDPLAAAGAGCAMAVLALIWLIVFIFAVIKFHGGKTEFGPEHEKNVSRGIIMLILIIVLYIVSVIVGAAGAFWVAGTSITGDVSGAIAGVVMLTMGVLVVGIIIAIMTGLMLMYLIKYFLSPEDRTKCLIATAMYAVAPVIGIVLAGMALSGAVSVAFLSYAGYPGKLVAVVGSLLFYLVYNALKKRMESGEIRPQPPGMPGMPGPMGPAPVGPAPAGPVPVPPPPQGPPPQMPY